MTNIFARKPLKSSTAVAKRYEPWITVFERLVSEAQKEITALSNQERNYNIVKEFLQLQDLPNDTKVDVYKNGVTVKIVALPTNTKANLEDLFNRFTMALFNAGVRPSKECPTIYWGSSYSYDVYAYFSTNDKASSNIRLIWDIPITGIADLEVKIERREVMTYDTSYKLVPRVKEIKDASV